MTFPIVGMAQVDCHSKYRRQGYWMFLCEEKREGEREKEREREREREREPISNEPVEV